ncbi:beta-L-arabinofuranosidase domain-containing protein [Arthrobacter silvisoli]|uniref:beta-L-arabinofuranosidase domain-containing protein n=1 Tax=Arthrobacter silvisoli TaxID=2291022 RepID=UPI0014440863|nr:beta-L-arabinofuranosidase domain-containing protein [Arthrobacter silvisoli]
MKRDYLPLRQIQLREGRFVDAQRVNREALLRLDPDRLLAPFHREAGLPATAAGYGGWESSGLDGHTAGHVLSALALAVAGDGDRRLGEMLGRMLSGLREAQLAGGTGYLGGVHRGPALWDELARGEVTASPFELNGRWVPLYNLHKTLAGLVDVAWHVPSAESDRLVDELGNWWLETMARLDQETLERVLVTEFGGLTESFARLALLRRDTRYLYLAKRFVREELITRVLALPGERVQDSLAGLHANTQIPVVVGYATIARVARELGVEDRATARIGEAAKAFFDDVAGRRSSAIGGNSVREHFHRRDDFTPMFLGREGPESCNSYNMVKLAAELYLLEGEDHCLDYIEVTQCSHVLSTQHPDHGGLVYFTSHRPGHYRVYSPEQDGFWCCMGSGYEAHAKHGAHVYVAEGEKLRITWLLASELSWEEQGVQISIDSDWPAGSTARVRVTAPQPRVFTLAIRVPQWARGAAAVLGDGRRIDDDGAGWWTLCRRWEGMEEIRLSMEREPRLVPAPDGSAWAWIQYGPAVLAEELSDDGLDYRAGGARTAHIASGPLRPLSETPVLLAGGLDAVPQEGEGLSVLATDGQRVRLKPLHRIHDSRYRLSWPLAQDVRQVSEVRYALAGHDRASTALEARVVDGITFGEQQPELDHGVSVPHAERGLTVDGTRWLRPRGPLSLTLRDWTTAGTSLRVEWVPGEDEVTFLFSGGDHPTAVEVTAGADGVWEMPFTTGGEQEVRLLLAPREGRPMPRLSRLLLLTGTADSLG